MRPFVNVIEVSVHTDQIVDFSFEVKCRLCVLKITSSACVLRSERCAGNFVAVIGETRVTTGRNNVTKPTTIGKTLSTRSRRS